MADKFHKLEGVKFPVGSQTAQEIKSLCARYASHKKKVAFKLKQYTEAALAHENNPDDTSARKLAKKLANQYRFSFRGRLIAVITENKKLDWGKRRSLSQCFSLAKNLTAHKQSDEAVRVAFKPKANGGQRPVQDFGLQQRATQELAKTIIERRVHPQKWQYTFLGVPKAIRFLKHLDPAAEMWTAKLDIEDFYGHFNDTDLGKLTWEVPKSVVKATLLSKGNVLMDYEGVPLAGSSLLEAHRGVAQGSIVSPLLGVLAISKMDWSPGQKIECVNYADDFLLVAHTKSELEDAVLAFDLAIKTRLPGGSFHLKPASISKFGHGIEFLGHNLIVEKDGLKVDPCNAAIERLAQRLDELSARARKSIASYQEEMSEPKRERMLGRLAALLAYADGWRASFSECEEIDLDAYYGTAMDVFHELCSEAGVTTEEVKSNAPIPSKFHGTNSEFDELFVTSDLYQ
jgi:hypothetical protein|tara:strand:- start:11360 stop:12736 length:1377 start_codon:yes stop_codon:yes gene_type:complete